MHILRSLQGRLWFAFSLIIVATLLFLGLAFGAQAQRLTEVVLYTRLEEQARTLMPLLLQRARQQGDGADILPRLLTPPLPRSGNRPRILLVTRKGGVLFDSAPPALESITGKTIRHWRPLPRSARAPGYRGEFRDQTGRRWLVAGIPVRRRSPASSLYLAVAAPANENTILIQVWRQLLLSGLVALLAGLLVAILITRWLSRPIHQLSRATQAIAQGDLDIRLDPKEVPSEFTPLVENFNTMVDEVRRARQSQRNLIANVSHDLKTPITSIRGFAQALREGVLRDPEAQRHAAEVIYDEAERMHRMVIQLLELAQMDAGQLILTRRLLDLAQVIEQQVESVRLRASERGISLQSHVDSPLPVLGDADRLAEVVSNLLENALTHTPMGGTVRVEATTEPGPSGKKWVTFHVVDTGSGIAEEDLPHIFERFYRGDKSRGGQGGSGLGLAIVKELVEAHGGRISVQSVVGLGTRFTVRLPAASGIPQR